MSSFKANVARIASTGVASQVPRFAATPSVTQLRGPGQFGRYAVFSGRLSILAGLFTLKYDVATILPKDRDSSIDLAESEDDLGAVELPDAGLVMVASASCCSTAVGFGTLAVGT
jgi:hypothetical protein